MGLTRPKSGPLSPLNLTLGLRIRGAYDLSCDSYIAPNIKPEVGGVYNTACSFTLIFYSMYGPMGGFVSGLSTAAKLILDCPSELWYDMHIHT